MKPNPIEVGQRIKSIRKNKGMSLEEFGNLFDAHKSNVSKWEKGMSLPNNERTKLIAKIGELSVNELLNTSPPDYELMWNELKKEVSDIAPGSIDQSLAFKQVLEIMNKLEEEIYNGKSK